MLQSTDTDLKSYIQTLQEQLPALQEADAELDKRIDALKTALKDDVSAAKAEVLAELGAYKTSVNNQIKSLNEAIAYLQEKDAALEDEIDSLKDYVDKQLASSKDWAATTFATLVQFNDLSEDVAGIKVSVTGLQDDLKKTNEDLAKAAEDFKASVASLDASIQQQIADLTTNFNDALSSVTDKITAEYQAAIGKAIQDSEASIKKWINEQLTGYYTIAETDEKLDALQKTLEGQLNTQKAYLEDLISSLSTTLTQKIEENRTLIDELSTNADTQSQLISANAASISSNAEAILQNAGNISKNAGDIETCNQLIAANLSLIEQNQTAIETNAGRLKDLDGQVSSNVTAIAKNAENIAQNAALISTNATAISNNAAAITQNASDILQLRNSLTATKKEITDAYTEAISKAINQLDGKLSSQMTSEINTAVSNLESRINEKIAGLTKRVSDIEDDIKGIHTQISEILADIASIHESIRDLLNRIQSITVIPTVSDGSVAINRYYNDFNFEVYPLSVAQKLPELSLSCFSMRAAQTIQTKSDISFIDMPVSKVSYADGILTVTASAANFDLDFFAGEHGESARLLITYDNISISSGYFSLSTITVIPISSVSLNKADLFLTEGESESLIVTVKPDNATDKTVTWTSSKESVATVDRNGKVEAVGVGIATITAKAGELTANCDVKVSESSGGGNIPDNEIWYTTTDGATVTPNSLSFGATILSNIYENGKGVITFDNPVSSIGNAAFKDCTRLSSITIPEGITFIDRFAFINCSSLSEIALPSSLERIGESAFEKTALSLITIPTSCIRIDDYAFYGCDQLSISIPTQLEYLGSQSFCRCRINKDIVIPSGLTHIGVNPFRDCEINSITVDANNPAYNSKNDCNAIIETATAKVITACKNTRLPVGVLEVGERAFNVKGIVSATIPSTVKIIHALAFYYDMTDLYCHPFVMPKGGFETGLPNPEYVLHIPKGSSDKYTNWKGSVEEIPDRVVVEGGDELRTIHGKNIVAVKVIGTVEWKDISYVYSFDDDDDYTYSPSIREYDFSEAMFPAQSYTIYNSVGDPYFSTSAEANVVGQGMFCYGRTIESLVLPNSILRIERSSLYDVVCLEIPSQLVSTIGLSSPEKHDMTIVCDATNPPNLSVCDFVSGSIFVPSISLDSYKESTWNDHFMIYGR